MTTSGIVWSEIQDARMQMRPVKQIRVSADAIAGAPVTTPISPERLRTMALCQVKDGVIADPEAQERWLEIVVHPADWADLNMELPQYFAVNVSKVTCFFGIEVVK